MPILTGWLLLFSTGVRRGEMLGFKWGDVDFARREIAIRRAITARKVTTPKSGRGRSIGLSQALAEALFDLLATRRREALSRGWADTPEWVFCSGKGTALDERSFARRWERLRRRAQAQGIRPLKLHAARRTWAALALEAGNRYRTRPRNAAQFPYGLAWTVAFVGMLTTLTRGAHASARARRLIERRAASLSTPRRTDPLVDSSCTPCTQCPTSDSPYGVLRLSCPASTLGGDLDANAI